MTVPALVIQAHANHGAARTADGRLLSFHFPRRLARPLPGDHIELDDQDSLVAIADRRNEFGRGDARGRFRPVATNLDRALIVIAPQPAPSPDLLHRYLATAHIKGIEPVIVINKTDLPIPDQPPFSELADLAQLGYQIIECRCKPTLEIAMLLKSTNQGVSLLAGQSGVGKTSLLNALVPDLDRQTGALSRVTGKGVHTTTSATVHQLPGGAWLVDTPGVWEYGLWTMTTSELAQGFPEFAAIAGNCRFRDCSHNHEPGCAVADAAGSNEIPASRYQAWLRLLAEQTRLGRR
jgi:ribosome biogenesis GTPase / thiamine phosphate phosphatase